MAAKVLEFPFTYAQWKELERQSIIYKFMMESIPLPPDLLFPSTTTTTTFAAQPAVACQTRGSGKVKDTEPGRCKRTDGKKWRCSRDVAPNHKYCERHLHRGRPRSRKPVEVQVQDARNKRTRPNSNGVHDTAAASAARLMQETAFPLPPNREIPLDLSINTSADRDMRWNMEGKMQGINRVAQQWPQFIGSRVGLASSSDQGSIYNDRNAPVFQQDYAGEPLNLFSYRDLAAAGDDVQRDYECQFFLNNTDIKPHPRAFMDAWSNHDNSFKNTPVSNKSPVSPCSLTLSMAMAAEDDKMGKIEEGDDCIDDLKSSDCSGSWVPFARGGPLAEVLHPGTTKSEFTLHLQW